MWIWFQLRRCFTRSSCVARTMSRRRLGRIEPLELRIVPTAVTGYEQYFLELMNRARQDPVVEAARLGIDLNEGLPAGTLPPGARQPLALNDSLQASIEGHLADELAHNYFGHNGFDGSTYDSRINAAGYTGWTTIGENLAIQYTSGSINIQQFVTDEYVNLFKDTTVADRGHRINIVDGLFKEAGSAVQSGTYQGQNAVDTGNDFGARPGNSFLTGVIYTDAVTANNFYDVGEGLGGISVDVTGAGGTMYHTTANAAGGYQIALPAGTYRVQFFGTGMSLPIIKNFTIGSLNVEVDANTRVDVGTSGPPVLSGTSSITYIENGTAVSIDTAITETDPGRTTLTSATVTISNFIASQDVLGFIPNSTTMGNISVSSNSNGVLMLASSGGSATLAQWQAALRSVTYANTSDNPSTVTRNVSFVVDDGQSTNHASNVLATTIGVTAVNDPPVISNIGYTFNYVISDPATLIAPTVVVSDVDNTTLVSATVQITGNFTTGQDQLSFTNTATITATFDSTNGKLSLTGTDTVAHYQAALRSVRYFKSLSAPNRATRTFSVQVDDGSAANRLSSIATRSLTISAVNPAPVLRDIETTSLSYKGSDPASLITSSVAVTDPDSDDLVGATIQISSGYQSGADTLLFTNTSSITGTFDPTTGKLTLSGNDTVSNYRSALRAVGFQNASSSQTVGLRTISFQVNDGASSQSLSNIVTRTVSVTNGFPPVLAGMPGTVLAFTEKDPATAIAPALTVADPDSVNLTGATIQIVTNYAAGQDQLSFVNSASVTSSFNATTGVLTLSGTKSLAAYQTMLQSVTYLNTHNNPSTATRSIQFVVYDNFSNPSNPVSRSVSVTPVNDPPVIYAVESTTLSYVINSPATPISPALLVTDPDSDNLSGATIQISSGYQSGADLLTFANTSKITAAFNAASGTLTLSGIDSVSNYRTALRSVALTSTSVTPVFGLRTILFQANDGSAANNLSNVATRTVNVVNGVPSILAGVSATVLAFTERDPATVIAPAITISDVDSVNLSGATVQITGNYTTFQDRLAFVNSAGVTANFDSVTGTLTLSGSRTLAAYQTMLQSVTYQNIHNNPNTATRTVQFTVVDDTANLSNSVTRNVSITPVNDPPVIYGVEPAMLTYVTSSPATPISAALLVTDPDSDNLSGATIQISSGYQSGADLLTFANTSKITASYNATSGTLTLSGIDSVSNYRTALRSVAFVNSSLNPIYGMRTIRFQANDGSAANNLSNVATRVVNVVAGVAPVLAGMPATILAFTEKDPATVIAPAITVSDTDSVNLSGATIQITGNYTTFQDRLAFVNSAGVTANFDSVTGTLALSGSRTLAAYQTMLQSVTYQNIHNNPNTATRTVQFTVVDDTANLSNSLTRNISITPVNDPPVIYGVETTPLAYATNAPATAISPALLVTDPDSDYLTAASIRIASNYQSGQDILSFVNTSNLTATWNAATGTLTITGVDTVSNYRTALRSVMYRNTSATPSLLTRSVSVQVSDLSGGVLDSNLVTRSITIS